MMPNPYVLLGAGLFYIASLMGVFFYGEHVDSLSYKVAIAKQAEDGQRLLADAQAKIIAQVQANAELNNQIEADHATAQSIIESASDAYADAVARRVQPRSTVCGTSANSAKADHPGNDKNLGGSGIFVSQPTLVALGLLAKSADETVATMQTCKEWALRIGQ